MYVYRKNNGFVLEDALFALLIVTISISLLFCIIQLLPKGNELIIDEQINKKWFYSD